MGARQAERAIAAVDPAAVMAVPDQQGFIALGGPEQVRQALSLPRECSPRGKGPACRAGQCASRERQISVGGSKRSGSALRSTRILKFGAAVIARKPNYDFERRERERNKAAEAAKKAQAKAEKRAAGQGALDADQSGEP